MQTNDIVGRIRKLLELSRNNTSAEEAALAAARAQDMMFKYQIGESDLDITSQERVAESTTDGTVMQSSRERREVWKGVLANTIARAFGCKCYTSRGLGEVRIQIFGLTSAVQTVNYMFNYLVLEINRLADEAHRNSGAGVHGKTFKNSFRMGAINSISSRLAEQTRAQQAVVAARVASGSTAIALYKTDQERVEDEYKTLAKKLNLRSAAAPAPIRSVSAYHQGVAAGRSIGLGGGKGIAASKARIEQ